MIKLVWVIVLITGSDSSSSLPQTRYSTKEACMQTVNQLLIGDWRSNNSASQIGRSATAGKWMYATCISTEEK